MGKKILGAVVLTVLILVGAKMYYAKSAKAAGQATLGVCVSTVPQAWGQFKGGSEQTGLAFEDTRGTLRFVTSFPCNGITPPIALEITRTAGN